MRKTKVGFANSIGVQTHRHVQSGRNKGGTPVPYTRGAATVPHATTQAVQYGKQLPAIPRACFPPFHVHAIACCHLAVTVAVVRDGDSGALPSYCHPPCHPSTHTIHPSCHPPIMSSVHPYHPSIMSSIHHAMAELWLAFTSCRARRAVNSA